MRALIAVLGLIALLATGCGDAVLERVNEARDGSTDDATESPSNSHASDSTPESFTLASEPVASLNGRALSARDIELIDSAYGLQIGPGEFWYDPVSGAWGYWGGPTIGFLAPNMELGRPPIDASGGGTGVVLNGRELHPVDLNSLQQLVGYIYPGHYWLDAGGYFGYEGGPALGNLISVARGSGSNASGSYFESTYFGNIGSDGQSSYFYDSDSGCSVMSDGGLSC